MQQQRFDIHKAPVTPLRAEPRIPGSQGAAGHIQGVSATSGGLVRSTLIAGGAAVAILTLFYLPAEYGIDPTGVGAPEEDLEHGEWRRRPDPRRLRNAGMCSGTPVATQRDPRTTMP